MGAILRHIQNLRILAVRLRLDYYIKYLYCDVQHKLPQRNSKYLRQSIFDYFRQSSYVSFSSQNATSCTNNIVGGSAVYGVTMFTHRNNGLHSNLYGAGGSASNSATIYVYQPIQMVRIAQILYIKTRHQI